MMHAYLCSMHLMIIALLQQASAQGSLVSLLPADTAICEVLTASTMCVCACVC